MDSIPDALPSPAEPKRKLSIVQLSVKIQNELDPNHVSKSGKTRLSNKFRNDMIMKRGSLAYCIAQHIIELEKGYEYLQAHRLETGRMAADTIYEIIKLANDISDVAAFKIIKNARKKELQASDLPECAFGVPWPNSPEQASLNKLLRVLSFYGILSDDPRLAETIERQKQIEEELEEQELATNPFSKEHFVQCIHPSVELISRAFRNELEIPLWRDFTAKVKEIFEDTKKVTTGSVASYIPQLSRQDPNWFGMSICTIDGSRFHLGDSKVPFCLQSVSKAFTYACVATEIGSTAIHNYVGHEPSGRNFNEICLDSAGKPHNPMVNAGAIIVTSLINNDWPLADRFDKIIEKYRQLAGTYPVEFNNATFLSERDSADRNYALAYFMKENNCFPHSQTMNLREELEFYFQLCSLECNCETLSVMAATLANGGVNPLTYERCMSEEACRDALSLMFSCGMYDLSGRFAFEVGLPAKSGVSGAIMVIIPSVMGLCLFSPRLDSTGNSTRGVAFCRKFVNQFSFHNYDSIRKQNVDRKVKIKKHDPRREVQVLDIDNLVNLLFAVKRNDLFHVQRLFLLEFDLEMPDYEGRTALHIAAAEGHYEITKFLLSTAAVTHNPVDRMGNTPYDEAVLFNHHRVARLLYKYHKMEMIAQGNTEGSDMSDLSEFSGSEDEQGHRTRRPTIVEVDRSRVMPLPPPVQQKMSFVNVKRLHSPRSPLNPPFSLDTPPSSSNSPSKEEEEEEESEVDSEDDQFVPMAHREHSNLDLPPMIKRPSSHGFKR